MSATVNTRRGTNDIVQQLVRVARAVEVSPGVKAFDRVEWFDSEVLEDAFRYLLISEKAVCVVVMLDESFEMVLEGPKGCITRRLPVGLLISDRVLGSRQKALSGDGAAVVGAMGLMELLLPAVSGELLAPRPGPPQTARVVVEPKSVGVMSVRDTEKKLAGRVSVCLEVDCVGGRVEWQLAKGPAL